MATDPEFLAMRGIKRNLEMLESPQDRKRVIDWVVSKVNDEHTCQASAVASQTAQTEGTSGVSEG